MSDHAPPRRRLYPDGIGPVQLYHHERVMAADIARCADVGWDVLEFDSAPWVDEVAFHDDLARGFGFPSHYGRNLDALNDLALDVAAGHFGFPPGSVGGVLVFRRIDVLAGQAESRLWALLDIFVGASIRGLEHGWPLAILAQSDDRKLRCQPVAALVVDWNPAERSSAGRGGS